MLYALDKMWSNVKNTIKKYVKNRKTETEKEYSKRMLNRILNHCLPMMWCSYLLAFMDKITIAEALSQTIATVIVGAVVSYFASKTFENINKYGSRLNNTAIDQFSVPFVETSNNSNNIIFSTDSNNDELKMDC